MTDVAERGTTTQQAPRTRPSRLVMALSGLIAAASLVLAASGGYLYGRDRPAAERGTGTVDIGFFRDMSAHHQQAITMATQVRQYSTDPAVRTVAFDIDTAQTEQLGAMTGWLEQRNLARANPDPMAWMSMPATSSSTPTSTNGMGSMNGGMGSMNGMPPMKDMTSPGMDASSPLMPGMATGEEMSRLSTARGEPMDVLFLQLMIRHHQGGVIMASFAMRNAEESYVRELARRMYDGQSVEITQMLQLLRSRGANPLPAPR